jgi:D-alanyl-D-alanine-carboxypeptidase/D-alanyl-D-alanine-endopeptidase
VRANPSVTDNDTFAAGPYSTLDAVFADYTRDSRTPGLIFGVVSVGRPEYIKALGFQDLASKRPVTRHTVFRVASLTKAFTALTVLKLRDEGLIKLDALAETYVPELINWKYPTRDSPRIRVRDLLTHTAGFVTDDPWGDRQTLLPETEFTRLLRAGVSFARTPGTGAEYSNLGYAILGRIITNVSGKPYNLTIGEKLLKPLGMDSSGFASEDVEPERRAVGYSWSDDAWLAEPLIPHGSFGAMGGLHSNAADYGKWVEYLLSAWPPRDDEDPGPVGRATVRELAQGSSFPDIRGRFGLSSTAAAGQASAYGMGMVAAVDKDLGFTLSHTGGYPGFGAHVLLLPKQGVGLFAFANRTYACVAAPVWDAAMTLWSAGCLKDRPAAVNDALATAYRAVQSVYRKGNIEAANKLLAINILLDRPAQGWIRDIARLKAEVGECIDPGPLTATSNLSGEFLWTCAHGRVLGSMLLAPTREVRIQQVILSRKMP